tara:strand:- start:757 stop:1134 length:378 start_codon:yes stop_codon:yes gene_type:complete
MLVCGYVGEAFSDGTTGHSVLWGVLSTIGYLYIAYTVWFGEVAQLAEKSNSDAIKKGVKYLAWFVLVGWSIYPLGYMCMPGGWLANALEPGARDVLYNLADAINKIGFGLVVYAVAIAESNKKVA